ncbi:flap endonuclease-1 [Candidatus Woesearchaeota archaeon]|nr:flap endonuclease-1 [Candidatus Woesearchaeota archaeon]
MGVKIFDIIPSKEILLKDLANKIIVIDGNLNLYQFLSSIRQRDGSLLQDSHGNVTSHLSGLFNRTTRLMQQGIKVCYVFDGKAPKLKQKERERRHELKELAEKKYEEAKAEQDLAAMHKYASRTSRLTPEMTDEAKKLIAALGLPVVQAPSEGEAQASKIVSNNHAFAVGSQDADCLMFGATRLIKNLTLNTSRKNPNKLAFTQINPELVELQEVLTILEVTPDQLIALSVLIGTDFNPGGIPGIGPKHALKNIKKYITNFDTMFKELGWENHFPYPWQEVFDTIKNMPTTDDYSLKWQALDQDKIIDILCTAHDFSAERVMSQLEKLNKISDANRQTGLNTWFK